VLNTLEIFGIVIYCLPTVSVCSSGSIEN